MNRLNSRVRRHWYHARVLGAVAGVLLLLIALVNLWPIFDRDLSGPASWTDVHTVQMDEIVQTAQLGGAPPPPPLPPIPVQAEVDFLVDVPKLDFDITLPDAPAHDVSGQSADGTAEISAGPEHRESARPVRFVEPEYTPAARRQGLRAEMDVQLQVDQLGRVVDMEIVQSYLVNDTSGERQPVEAVGYGLEEAARNAATRWVFRPARINGQPVDSFFAVTFTFGE